MGILSKLLRRDRNRAGPFAVKSFSDFNEFLKLNKYVLVDFWGRRCPPCEAMEPIVKKLAKEYSGEVVFLKINASTEIADRFKVRSVPAFLFFKDGRMKGRRVGAMKYEVLKKWIDGMIA